MLTAATKKEKETKKTAAITSTMGAYHQQPTQGLAPRVGRFLLHFLELQIPMALGATVCFLLGRLVAFASNFARVYHPGTYLFAIGDVLFLTVPVVAWMIMRGHGRRYGLEMALAMTTPVAVIAVVGEVAGYDYLWWLITGMYPAMWLGMLGYMLYHPDHFTQRTDLRSSPPKHNRTLKGRVSMATISGYIKGHPLLSFFVLAFVFAWIWVLPIYRLSSGGILAIAQVSPVVFLFLFLGEAGSGVTGFILAGVVGGRAGIRELLAQFRRWRVGLRWYLVAIFTTAAAAIPVLFTLTKTISADFLPPILTTDNIVLLITIALAIGLPAGFTEEWGWAGYALPRLLAKYRAFTTALVLGLVWSAWHILLIFWAFPIFPRTGTVLDPLGALAFLGALVPYRILLSWVYINTKGSLFLVIVMHVFYDATLALLLPPSPVAQVLFYAGLNVVLWIFVIAVVQIYGAKTMAGAGASAGMKRLELASE